MPWPVCVWAVGSTSGLMTGPPGFLSQSGGWLGSLALSWPLVATARPSPPRALCW